MPVMKPAGLHRSARVVIARARPRLGFAALQILSKRGSGPFETLIFPRTAHLSSLFDHKAGLIANRFASRAALRRWI